MARPEAFWDQIRDAFEPGEVLVGQRSRELYCEREHSPFARMCAHFRTGRRRTPPPTAFFTGHRGSGKSSLLWRLLDHFKDEYFIVYFDVDHNLDTSQMNQIDLLYLIGATIFQVAVEEGLEPNPEHLKQLANSISTLARTEKTTGRGESVDVVALVSSVLCFGASTLGGPMAEKLAQSLLKPFKLSAGVSEEEVRKREIEPQIQQIINDVNLIIADVQTRCERPLLVAVDGLDKLQRQDQAKLIFIDSRALYGPVCNVIYTVPMVIYTSLEFSQAEQECKPFFLPNVKVYERPSGDRYRRYRKGYELLEEVVAKRLRGLEIAASELFAPRALDLLIKKSGGVMRWFIGLVQDAGEEARILGQEQISLAAARRAIAEWESRLAIRLTISRIEELRTIRSRSWPSGGEEVGDLLQSLLIVAYRNQDTWFDAHPLIWEALKE